MKICDNFDNIYPLLLFNNEGDYYIVKILMRNKKDNNQDSKYNYYLKNRRNNFADATPKVFYLFSKDDLYKYKDEMIALSELYNARVYIYLQRKNLNFTYKNLLKSLSNNFFDNITPKDLEGFWFDNVCEYSIDDKYKYLVDLDKEYLSYRDYIYNYLQKYNSEIIELKSLDGIHLIIDNIDEFDFQSKFPDIKLHINRPTLLYYKSDIE